MSDLYDGKEDQKHLTNDLYTGKEDQNA